MTNPTRRSILALTGTALTGTLAGCTTSNATSTPVTDTDPDTEPTFSDNTRESLQTIAEQARPSIVEVDTGNGSGGTGWVMNNTDAHILTNSHVVRNNDTVEITTYNNNTHTGTVIGNTDNHIPDVALIEINNANEFDAPALAFGNDTTLERGDPLLQIGHPGNVGTYVSAIGEYVEHIDGIGWFTSTVVAQSGNSGSPVLDITGSVVGMTSGNTTVDGENNPSKHTETPPKLYTEYPDETTRATHVPISDIAQLAHDWTTNPGK